MKCWQSRTIIKIEIYFGIYIKVHFGIIFLITEEYLVFSKAFGGHFGVGVRHCDVNPV